MGPVRIDVNDACHPPISAVYVILHHDNEVVHAQVFFGLQPFLSLVEKHNVFTLPMEPKSVHSGLDANPRVSRRLGVGGGGREDVVGGARGGARVEQMCWGEGLEVGWIVAVRSERTAVNNPFDLNNERLEGADVERVRRALVGEMALKQ